MNDQTILLQDEAWKKIEEGFKDLETWAQINKDLLGKYIRGTKIECYLLKKKFEELEK